MGFKSWSEQYWTRAGFSCNFDEIQEGGFYVKSNGETERVKQKEIARRFRLAVTGRREISGISAVSDIVSPLFAARYARTPLPKLYLPDERHIPDRIPYENLNAWIVNDIRIEDAPGGKSVVTATWTYIDNWNIVSIQD